MALGTNAITNGLVSGITGNINKGYILLHKPETNPAYEEEMGGQSGLSSGLAAMSAGLQGGVGGLKNAGRNLGVSTSGINALGVDSTLMDIAGQNGYFPVQVQFNPSRISFQGMGGEIRRESVGGAGENQFQQFTTPSETVLGMELIFDDTNNKDAFMMDANLPVIGELTSPGNVMQRVQQGISGAKDGYSVQDTTELFIGAMVLNYTRLVGFAWNKMIFWGELVGVSVKYTMFNKSGAPIRAIVSIQIRQDQMVGGNTPYETEKEWEKTFQEMFKAGKTSMLDKANGNLLNLN